MTKRQRQRIFNKVVKHLLTQKKKSVRLFDDDRSWSCAYRGKDGLKCAIGCLIEDHEYTRAMDKSPQISIFVNSKINNFLKEKGYLKTLDDFEFLIDLQSIHDETDPFNWKKFLREFGEDRNLDLSIFDKIK